MTKLAKVLDVVNNWEETGKVFFNRNSNGDMSIVVRDPRLWGGNPNVEHWANAWEIIKELNSITGRVSDPKIDRQSGCLVIIVYGIYAEAA